MRMFKAIVFILSIAVAITVNAQQDTIKLMDIAVVMVQPEDTSTTGSAVPLDFRFSTFVKVSNVDSVDVIYLKLGTAPDYSEFISETLTVQFHNNSFCMDATSNAQHYPFWSDATSYSTLVPYSQTVNVRWLTIWARHKNGHICAKKYYQIF